jgi:hypothetical protein
LPRKWPGFCLSLRGRADIPPIREAIQWHITNNNDRALRWVVERLAAMAHEDRTEISNVVPLAEAQRDEIAVHYQHNHPYMRGEKN